MRSGRVTVDGAVVKDPSKHIAETAAVACDGHSVQWSRYQYIMLHKPTGYVSSTEDKGKTVMELLPPACIRLGMFPCGRLDIDTTGLLLITNDGPSAHDLLSPRHHVAKTYAFTCATPLSESAIQQMETGLAMGDFTSQPAKVKLDTPQSGEITITEGKFHQIKRMFEAIGRKITSLERLSFGPLSLDPTLERGAWRKLTEDEISLLLSAKERANEDSNFFK